MACRLFSKFGCDVTFCRHVTASVTKHACLNTIKGEPTRFSIENLQDETPSRPPVEAQWPAIFSPKDRHSATTFFRMSAYSAASRLFL